MACPMMLYHQLHCSNSTDQSWGRDVHSILLVAERALHHRVPQSLVRLWKQRPVANPTAPVAAAVVGIVVAAAEAELAAAAGCIHHIHRILAAQGIHLEHSQRRTKTEWSPIPRLQRLSCSPFSFNKPTSKSQGEQLYALER